MTDKQVAVERELTSFVDELRTSGGVAEDVRFGVITTSVYEHVYFADGTDRFFDCETIGRYCGESGRLQPVPDAAADGGVVLGTGVETVLEISDPQLVDKFSRLVRVGVLGSGQETPFEALRLALTSPLSDIPLDAGGNLGFLRDGARLLIVVVSDADDCSEQVRPSTVKVGANPGIDDCHLQAAFLAPVADYFDVFSNVKDSTGTRKDIVYTIIAGVSTVTKNAMYAYPLDAGDLAPLDCSNAENPGFRHHAMAQMFDMSLENLDSVCKADYHDTLLNIANLAGVSQVLELDSGVPDPSILKVVITRKDGTTQTCTSANGGISIEAQTATTPTTRIHFEASCLRHRDDSALEVSLLCVF